MTEIANALQLIVLLFKLNAPYAFMILGVLWGIQVVNWLLGYRLNIFGIYPRHILGMFGIVLSPFLHGDFNHLFFNSIPLFVFTSLILIGGIHHFLYVTLAITVLGGTGIWLFGRRAIHIGASHVIMGYWSYLLVNAYHSRTVIAILLGIITLYYFSGLILNLFPTDVKHSWEGHVFGFFAGIAVAYLLPLNF